MVVCCCSIRLVVLESGLKTRQWENLELGTDYQERRRCKEYIGWLLQQLKGRAMKSGPPRDCSFHPFPLKVP